jgi:hypothetical protein
MTPQEKMRNEYYALYNTMANSNNIEFMHIFGQVHKEVMEWAIANKPDLAQEWIDKLSAIRWKNYVTQKEAEAIVSQMNPRGPWSRDQWKQAMEKAGYPLEDEPYYNSCALYVTMNMIMSDSSSTLTDLVGTENLFKAVYLLAIDKLKDKDGKFKIRDYFGL